MAYQPTIIIGACLLIASTAVYTLAEKIGIKSLSQDVLEKYTSYNNQAEIIQARNVLNHLHLRQEEVNTLREVCLTDIPEDEQGTKIHQLQYCTNRAIKAMGFDYKLSELQQMAFKPLPSDVLNNSCKVSFPSTILLFQHVKKETTNEVKFDAEKFVEKVLNQTGQDS